METLTVEAAKTHLSQLLARVEAGENIVLVRDGRPIAKLVPFAPRRGNWPDGDRARRRSPLMVSAPAYSPANPSTSCIE